MELAERMMSSVKSPKVWLSFFVHLTVPIFLIYQFDPQFRRFQAYILYFTIVSCSVYLTFPRNFRDFCWIYVIIFVISILSTALIYWNFADFIEIMTKEIRIYDSVHLSLDVLVSAVSFSFVLFTHFFYVLVLKLISKAFARLTQ